MPVPVFILHAAALRFSQTVRLRGFQLAEIGARYLGRDFEFLLRAVPPGGAAGPWVDDLRGGIVLLSAGVAGCVPEPVLLRLRAANRAVLADWRGEAPAGDWLGLIDLHLFGTLAALRAARRADPGRAVAYLTWHADLAVQRVGSAPQDRLRPVWPGDPSAWPAALAGRVARAAPGTRHADILPHLGAFNLHLVAGPVGAGGPLAPLFAAAAVGATVALPADVPDAVDYLGRDYPYLLPDAAARTFVAVLDRAEADFGGPRWRKACERMRNMADRSSPGLVASDLAEILARVADQRAGSDAA